MEHRIRQQRLVVDVAGITPREAGGWHDRMERLHHRVIAPTLTRQFDRLAPAGRTLSVDRLHVVVDLAGHASVEAAVEAGFAEALRRALDALPPAPEQSAEVFAGLYHFLATGNLPLAAPTIGELRRGLASWLPDAIAEQWRQLLTLAKDRPEAFFGRGAQVQRSFPKECLSRFARLAHPPRPPGPRARQLPLDTEIFTLEVNRLSEPVPEEQPAAAPTAEAPRPPIAAVENLYPGNAGLVLLHPYFAYFMDQVACDPAREPGRAAALLHFLVYSIGQAREWDLPLIKVLLGLDPEDYLLAEEDVHPADRSAAEELLRGVITHWSVLGNTGIDGLREGFLQRPGVLRRGGHGYHLDVERHAIDVLMDRLPWSISLVKTPWMANPLQVRWI